MTLMMLLRPRGAAARRLSLSTADLVAGKSPDTREPKVAQSLSHRYIVRIQQVEQGGIE